MLLPNVDVEGVVTVAALSTLAGAFTDGFTDSAFAVLGAATGAVFVAAAGAAGATATAGPVDAVAAVAVALAGAAGAAVVATGFVAVAVAVADAGAAAAGFTAVVAAGAVVAAAGACAKARPERAENTVTAMVDLTFMWSSPEGISSVAIRSDSLEQGRCGLAPSTKRMTSLLTIFQIYIFSRFVNHQRSISLRAWRAHGHAGPRSCTRTRDPPGGLRSR